jgi:hypothetical protein
LSLFSKASETFKYFILGMSVTSNIICFASTNNSEI